MKTFGLKEIGVDRALFISFNDFFGRISVFQLFQNSGKKFGERDSVAN